MELVEAARKQDWERAKVRRPLEADSSTDCGPTRAVCLGLGQWTLEAFRRTPDSAMLCRIQPPSPGAPQAISILNAGAPSCRSGRHVP
jgi:hypothetical protein